MDRNCDLSQINLEYLLNCHSKLFVKKYFWNFSMLFSFFNYQKTALTSGQKWGLTNTNPYIRRGQNMTMLTWKALLTFIISDS